MPALVTIWSLRKLTKKCVGETLLSLDLLIHAGGTGLHEFDTYLTYPVKTPPYRLGVMTFVFPIARTHHTEFRSEVHMLCVSLGDGNTASLKS